MMISSLVVVFENPSVLLLGGYATEQLLEKRNVRTGNLGLESAYNGIRICTAPHGPDELGDPAGQIDRRFVLCSLLASCRLAGLAALCSSSQIGQQGG